MSKPAVVRFWFNYITAGHPVRLKIAAGQTLRHTERIGDDIYHRTWRFDGDALYLRAEYVGPRVRLCAPVLHQFCAVENVSGGPIEHGVAWPAWRPAMPGRRADVERARAAIPEAAKKNDIDDACRMLQDILNVDDGGVAGMCFSNLDLQDWPMMSEDDRAARLTHYVDIEVIFQGIANDIAALKPETCGHG
jgi:hypothetical protein